MTKLYLSAFICVVTAACGSKKEDKPASGTPAPSGSTAGGECIVGEYEWLDGTAKRGFVFNADKSGKEIYEAGKDERPLTWSIKSASLVHLSYTKSGDNMGGEFDIPYDCAQKTVGSIATPYKRK